MKQTKIVFLLGCANSGKDTVGEMFVKKGYIRISFADAVKLEYAKIHNIDVNLLHEQGPIKELHRPGIITLAEEARAKDENIWITKGFEPYLDSSGNFKEGLKLVVTDCRRVPEIKWISKQKEYIYNVNSIDEHVKHYLDVKLFCVSRPGLVDTDYLTHQAIGFATGINYSGQEYPLIDGIINNDSTIKALQKKVDTCFLVEDL